MDARKTLAKILKTLVVAAALPLLYLADIAPDAGWTLMRDAHALIGAPATPLSGAGVARRTTRRVVAAESANTAATQKQQADTAKQQAATASQQAATAKQQETTAKQQAAAAQAQAAAARPAGAPPVGTVVNTLPAGCKAETKSGVEYKNCGGVYYRAAFQSNNLVYVVQ